MLYECAVIFLSGVGIAMLITGLLHFYKRPTISDFKREYVAAATPENQVVVAEKYIDEFPLQDIINGIDEQYASVGCHIQGHAIGRVLYKHNKNFSDVVQKCGGACTYGCFHGAMMEMFETESDTLGGVVEEETPAQYIAHITDSARNLCTKPEVESVVRPRQCYHGLGHVFAYSAGRDLRAATDACNIFAPREARSCRTGAYMEYQFSDLKQTREYVRSAQPCDAYPDDTYICLRYKAYSWLMAYGSIAAVMDKCNSFGPHILECIAATATAASSPKLLSTDEGIAQICGTRVGIQYKACIGGAFLNIINLNDGDDSEHLCDAVAPAFRDDCLSVRKKYLEDIYYVQG